MTTYYLVAAAVVLLAVALKAYSVRKANRPIVRKPARRLFENKHAYISWYPGGGAHFSFTKGHWRIGYLLITHVIRIK